MTFSKPDERRTKRRSSGDGGISGYRLANGATRYLISFRVAGKARRSEGSTTKRDAATALREQLGKVKKGAYFEPTRMTFGEFLTQRYLPVLEGQVRPSTYASYERYLRLHVVPVFGRRPLQSLDPAEITALYQRLAKSGRQDHLAREPLSPRTVQYIATLLKACLEAAFEWDLAPRNPAAKAKAPKKAVDGRQHEVVRTWTSEELGRFLRETRQDLNYPLWLLLATTGLRRGEALGLT